MKNFDSELEETRYYNFETKECQEKEMRISLKLGMQNKPKECRKFKNKFKNDSKNPKLVPVIL